MQSRLDHYITNHLSAYCEDIANRNSLWDEYAIPGFLDYDIVPKQVKCHKKTHNQYPNKLSFTRAISTVNLR